MSRTRDYSDQALRAIDELERGNDVRFLNAVADALDLSLDHGDSADARREALTYRTGDVWFKVVVRVPRTSWVVLWRPEGGVARIAYVGSF